MTPKEKISLTITAAVCANVLLIPAYLNGYLFFFIDSGRHLKLDLVLEFTPPFYNLWLYPLYAWNLPWVVGLAQSSLAVGLIWFGLRISLGRASAWALAATVGALTLGSSLPYQAGFALPDALTALGILAIVLAPFERPRLRVALATLTFYSAICHFSHVPIFAATFLGALGVHALVRRSGKLRISCFRETALALLLAFATQVSTNYLKHNRAVYSVSGPTFLFARLQADGLLGQYLREHCPEKRWAICASADQFPMPSSSFLWSPTGPGNVNGGFAALMDESAEIVTGVVVAQPAPVAANAARTTYEQLKLAVAVDIPGRAYIDLPALFEPLERDHPRIYKSLRGSNQFQGQPDSASTLQRAHGLISSLTLYAFPLLLALAWRQRLHNPVVLATTLACGVFANAAVCAIGSEVYPRYGSRAQWLASFAVLLLAMALIESWKRERNSRPVLPSNDPG